MMPASIDVSNWEGKEARLRIVDQETGGWGNIGVDHIVFSDRQGDLLEAEKLHDFGTMCLGVLGEGHTVFGTARIGGKGLVDIYYQREDQSERPAADRLTGAVGKKLLLEAGASATMTFVLAWHFPNLSVAGMRDVGREYASRFKDAAAVTRYVVDHFDRLSKTTRMWRDTWYDSTLPYWFLDRTMANTTTLATSTCHRFKDGRFWAWEGVGCCHGTCTHVWHYAQALGRLFPEIERDQRERVDFGFALLEDGGIGHRANKGHVSHPAVDGQCGRILGAYREHQMSPDSAFLRRNWSRIKKTVAYLIRLDANDDGIIEGSQPNTLDAAWYGKISFISSLYLAAIRAGQAMAEEMEDEAFARQCRSIAERGAKSILELYNGEYFIQKEDPAHLDAIGVGKGCYIDQVFGQSWAFQVGLGRLFDEGKIKSALKALWKYNFVPDVGPFRERFTRGRWYATAGDAGLLMCTWPRGGLREDYKDHWQYMYFNECMSGFEWQVASHMIWEGMLLEGLAVSRAIHDRYDGHLRNPYNEIECSDHYARAMASYGAFLAVCGFEYHGPKKYLAFAPRLKPEDFKAAFTAAEGWGTFSQQRTGERMDAFIEVRYGKLELETLGLDCGALEPTSVHARLEGRPIDAALDREDSRVLLRFPKVLVIEAGQKLTVELE
jgi:hypothetical protein